MQIQGSHERFPRNGNGEMHSSLQEIDSFFQPSFRMMELERQRSWTEIYWNTKPGKCRGSGHGDKILLPYVDNQFVFVVSGHIFCGSDFLAVHFFCTVIFIWNLKLWSVTHGDQGKAQQPLGAWGQAEQAVTSIFLLLSDCLEYHSCHCHSNPSSPPIVPLKLFPSVPRLNLPADNSWNLLILY